MIGIIGTGVMGRGIALQALLCGKDVILVGRDAEKTENCVACLRTQLASFFEKHAHTASGHSRLARPEIRSTLEQADLASCDAVIETVSEDAQTKRAVLLESERHIGDSCLLLTCSSSISISELSEGLRRPGRFIGMHFFNPAHIMPLVEIVPHVFTEPETIDRANDLAISLGKRSITVKDTPGFFVNRVIFAYIQGFCTLLKETGDYAHIDEVMSGNGWPMGPASLLDAIGVDTCFDIGRILVQAFPTVFSAAFSPVLEPLVKRGWTGRKAGLGFYRYLNSGPGIAARDIHEGAVELFSQWRNGRSQGDVPADVILDRLMLPVTNEVYRCIGEAVISTPEQADQTIFLSMGYGRKGGVCKQLKKTGIEAHLQKCEKYLGLGEIYRPPANLLALNG